MITIKYKLTNFILFYNDKNSSKIEKQNGRHIKIVKFDFSIFDTKYSHAVHQLKAYHE